MLPKSRFNEGRISQLSAQVLTAKLIEAPVNSDVALIGSTVTIVEQGEDDEEVYQIVGANEADPTKGKISNESRIGVALIGSRLNDVVTVKTPGGIIKFKVVKIS